ncbi:MAG: GNAT family N-acetyltransferase [Jatrophihabitantaceae bacterium]
MNVRVRPADISDVPGLVALTRSIDLTSGQFSGRAILDDSDAHLRERFAEILGEGTRTLLVAVDDSTGELAGLLVARPDEIGAVDLTPVLHVSHLIVGPKQRRRGIGRMLLAAVVHLAEAQGVERILATAAAGSREGNRYLARLGFAPLVVHRVASIAALRRSLGISEGTERMAVLRRARLVRAQRSGLGARVARRGA